MSSKEKEKVWSVLMMAVNILKYIWARNRHVWNLSNRSENVKEGQGIYQIRKN
jgi:hypothetical protein